VASGRRRRGRRGARGERGYPEGFGTIWGAVALDLVGFGIVLPILPIYAERYDASPLTIGLLVASFSLAQFVFSPVWGRVSDRVGRKPILVLSLAGTAVGSLVTGLAGTLWLLFLGRVVDGVSGASVSVAQAAVADLAEPEQRPRLLGLLGAAFGLGFVAGPALGALAAIGGPRVPFLVAAVIAGVNAVLAARRLPETRPSHAEAEAERAVVESIESSLSPVSDLGRLLLVGFASLAAFSAFEATFALFGERRLGLHLASTGAVFTVIGLLIALANTGLVHPATARLGEAGALRAGLAANAAGLLVLALVHSWVLLIPALVLLTAGQGLVTPTLSSLVAGLAGRGRRGGALGAQQAAGGLGRVLGPAAGGLLFQRVGVPAPFVAGGVLTLLAAAAAVDVGGVDREGKASGEPPVGASPGTGGH